LKKNQASPGVPWSELCSCCDQSCRGFILTANQGHDQRRCTFWVVQHLAELSNLSAMQHWWVGSHLAKLLKHPQLAPLYIYIEYIDKSMISKKKRIDRWIDSSD
jgi:hypothetical protein